jgi:hypothetical protein
VKRYLFILAIFFSVLRLFAQGDDVLNVEKRMPILGKIVTSDSLLPISNTHVISKMGHCGTISNRDGVFLIPARMVDTLWVSCLGYARKLIPVDSTLEVDTMQIVLERDTIVLKEVTVFPFYDTRLSNR